MQPCWLDNNNNYYYYISELKTRKLLVQLHSIALLAQNEYIGARIRNSAFYHLCLFSTVVINCYGDLLCGYSIHFDLYNVITNNDVTEALLRHWCDLIEFAQ